MQKSFSFKIPSIFSLLLLIIFGYFLFSLVKYIYIFLLCLIPVLALAILYYKKEVLFQYFRNIWINIRQQPLTGTLSAAISLFFTSFFNGRNAIQCHFVKKDRKQCNKADNLLKSQSGITQEYAEFEDISDELKQTTIKRKYRRLEY
jgi:hypothetical protein